MVNSHPVKAEMSVAAPKSQAKEPIQLDIVLVCRKADAHKSTPDTASAVKAARAKLGRLEEAGFSLSRNDRKIVLYGQLLTTLSEEGEQSADGVAALVERELVKLTNESRSLF